MNERQLNLLANSIRQDVIKSLSQAGTGHSADALGMADVLTSLYFDVLKHKPRHPEWKNRDRVLVNNGHIAPALYSALAHAGYFSKRQLRTLRQKGSLLHGRLNHHVPGVEATPGGLSVAVGCALGNKLDKIDATTYCVLSDEDHNRGDTWEAIHIAATHRLSRLTAIVDRNNIQAGGYTESIMPLESLRAKYEAFNWHVIEVDGHHIPHVSDALREAQDIDKPTVIIAHTVPGKGVSFMENDHHWHSKPPTAAQAEVALAELEHARRQL